MNGIAIKSSMLLLCVTFLSGCGQNSSSFLDLMRHDKTLIGEDGASKFTKWQIYTPESFALTPEFDSLPFNDTVAQYRKRKAFVANTLFHPQHNVEYLDAKDVLVIGNGGAGAVGLVEWLAHTYNEQAKPEDKLTIIWRGAHSFENFEVAGLVDSAITYEPTVEANLLKEHKISSVTPLFFNHLEIIAPSSDPLKTKQLASNDPIRIMRTIIEASFEAKNRDKCLYLSRYNHSAMGERDFLLFKLAIREIVKSQNNGAINLDQEVTMYNNWLGHVVQERTKFPWEMDEMAEKHHLYYVNDRVIVIEKNIDQSRMVTATGDRDLTNPLLNPAQFWTSSEFDENSKQGKFIAWLKSHEAGNVIEKFSLPHAPAGKKLFFAANNESFTTILTAAQKLEDDSANSELDTEWAKPKLPRDSTTTCKF